MIQDANSNALTYNYRPVQALNSRSVTYYDDNGGTSIVASLTLLSVTSALVTMLQEL